ncbi:MAG: MFS transporter, partial [Pseudomonadota bacterium]
LKPENFGFTDSGEAVRFSFLTVGFWWAFFSAPIFLFVKEPVLYRGASVTRSLKEGLSQLLETFQEVRRFKKIFLFLAAYWLYIDGVHTIIRMAVDYGISIGFESNDLIMALLITQFVGFPSSIAFGILGGRIGARRAIFITIAVYLFVSIWGAFMGNKSEFYILAVIIGLVQGGIQALSRSYFAAMIPVEKSAEYFGFYNMVGKFAVVLGPVVLGGVGLISRFLGSGSMTASRMGIASISLFFIAGGALFYFSKDENEARSLKPSS